VVTIVKSVVEDEFDASQRALQEHAQENTTGGARIEGDQRELTEKSKRYACNGKKSK
jgi:hypothetical protein